MANDDLTFVTDLLRWISASLFFQCAMTAGREMYGKSYFALGGSEKAAVDNTVFQFVLGNFQATTAEALAGLRTQQKAPDMGSQFPATGGKPH